VTDANVLINFMHVERLALLGALPSYTFVVPEPVVSEITDPGQVQQLQEALLRHAGLLSVDQADHAKAVLEQHRFRMVFASFCELLAQPSSSGQPSSST